MALWKMKHLLKFLIVTLFSIGFGLLAGLGFARLFGLQSWNHTISQFFILSIFVILAYKSGWLSLALAYFQEGSGAQPVGNAFLNAAALIVLGVFLGILARTGIQGVALWAFKIIDADFYLVESRDLVSLWRNSATPTAGRLVEIAIGATREEVMYRALVLGAMAHYFGGVRALVFSSIIFASIHLNPISFLFGLLFGLFYLISRSILLVSIMHSVANAWPLFVLEIFGPTLETANPADILDSQYGIFLSGSAALLIGAIAIIVSKGVPKAPWWNRADTETNNHSGGEKRVSA